MADPGDEEVDEGIDRVWTVPNVITFVRLACMPLFLWLLFGKDEPLAAAGLLAVLGATDWVDGYIARHYHQVSTLGKILDPVADRLLFFIGAGGILVYGAVPAWFAIVVLAREVIVSITTVGLALLGAKRIDVTWWGKAGTFCLMFSFPLFLASSADTSWSGLAEFAAWGWGIPGVVFGYIALALYVPIGLTALREGRAGRSAQEAVPS